MLRPEELYGSPNALAPHYSAFQVSERLLLTGHSHQAWPDQGFEGQRQAWRDAADCVDEKWVRAFERAERVREGFARLLGDEPGRIALGANTHELITRFVSALPLRERPRLLTTDGEFHTIRRQLDRLAEEGIEVVRVPSRPADAIAERLCAEVDARTAAVLVSAVLYRNAHIVPGLERVAQVCRNAGAELLVDAYHAVGVLPVALTEQGLEGAFVVGGGYKYCQLGEGNCFLRLPPDCAMRPVLTGWFAEFGALEGAAETEGKAGGSAAGRVAYGPGPARFAGSTYDPTSHYRAAEVFAFFRENELTPALLREVSRHQVGRLADRFDALNADPGVIDRDRSVPLSGIGGFLALDSPHAEWLYRRLRERGVHSDYRGETLRLGPAPYLADAQLDAAIDALEESLRTL